MAKINLEKQHSHYRNIIITGEISFDVPMTEDNSVFKTIKLKGDHISLNVENNIIHFGGISYEV